MRRSEPMRWEDARGLALVSAAALAIAACGGARGIRLGAKDSGATADQDAVIADSAADADVVAAETDTDTSALSRDSAGPETTIDRDSGPYFRDSGPDGNDASPDARDASSEGSLVLKDGGKEAAGRDGGMDSLGPAACKAALVPGAVPFAQTGKHPTSVLSGDLDGDGKLDLVTANYGSATVSVLLGQGDGTFAAKVDYATGAGPTSVALGDLNGDGKLDLVTANRDSATVSVLLGTGAGKFAAKMDLATAAGTTSAVLGDLNGDRKLDIVAVGYEAVSVLLGNGDGTFAAKVDYASEGYGTSVVLGDLNADGKMDLVVTAWAGSVNILLGNGDGTFAAKMAYPVGYLAYSVALGDLDGDGKLDLVVARAGSAEVDVLLGLGDGAFAPKIAYPTGSHPSTDSPTIYYPTSVALGDLNRDGKLDLVVANEGSATVSVLLGTGDGAFAPKIDYPAGPYPASVALGDLNGDGNPDVFAASYDSDAVSVHLGKGDGTFSAWAHYDTEEPSSSPALGDLNGDGKLDVVVANSDSNTVSVLLGGGDGTFAAKAYLPAGNRPSFVQEYEFVALGDLDGDGKLDLVAGSYNPEKPGRLGVLLGKGDGTFASRTDYPVADGPTRAALGDLNNDGKLDIVASSRSGYFGKPGTVSVLLGEGDGTFATNVDYQAGIQPYSVALADLNGDGKLDIVVLDSDDLNTSEVLGVLPGNGDGTFAKRIVYHSRAEGSVALGDLDGDGRRDLVLAGSDVVGVLLARGDGTFVADIVDYPAPGLDPGSAALGDLDGDGKLDLVTANAFSNTMSILLGAGDGTFAPKLDFAARAGSVELHDLDGDSNLDLVGVSGTGTLEVLLRSCR